MSSNSNKVAIIGAGASGLLAAKAVIEEGFIPCIYEKHNYSGGIWSTEADLKNSPANEELHTNVSKDSMSISDFPFNESYNMFPGWREMGIYLSSYKDNFMLDQFIFYGHKVNLITYHTGTYIIEGKNNNNKDFQETFEKVIICTGLYAQPHFPYTPNLEKYTGEISHAVNFVNSENFIKKRVLVVGYASSAIDISATIARSGIKHTISHRSPCVVMPNYLGNKPYDYMNSRGLGMLPTILSKNYFLNIYNKNCKQRGVVKNIKIYGHPDSKIDIIRHKVTSSRDFDHLVAKGLIEAQSEIADIKGKTVYFDNGNYQDYDHIIFATGYTPQIPVMNNISIKYRGKFPILYKHIFPLNHDNLAFIGMVFVRGGTFPFFEMQARYIAQVFSGKTSLPKVSKMENEIAKKMKLKQKKGIPWITEYPIPYMDDLAKIINVFPTFLHPPKLLLAIINGPFKSSQYRLKGSHQWNQAASYLLNFEKNTTRTKRD